MFGSSEAVCVEFTLVDHDRVSLSLCRSVIGRLYHAERVTAESTQPMASGPVDSNPSPAGPSRGCVFSFKMPSCGLWEKEKRLPIIVFNS